MSAAQAAASWDGAIDMLFLDGDQSPEGARQSYKLWAPFLREGGVLAINTTGDGVHPEGHDGSQRVVQEFVHSPAYHRIERVEAITLARRLTP
jgi:predicted O-methyltransferase YrrM